MFRKFVICMSIPFMAFAASGQNKVYVQLQDLVFDSDCIWYRDGDKRVRTGELHVDSMGYYVNKAEQGWRCAKCGFVNSGSYPGRGCRNCDFPFDFNQ